MKPAVSLSKCVTNLSFAALTLLTSSALAVTPRPANCDPTQQDEHALLATQQLMDPGIRNATLDSVFFSPKQSSCYASFVYTKRHNTYGGIFDISQGRMIWTKRYRGIHFSPARIVAIDRDIDQAIEAIEFPVPNVASAGPVDMLSNVFDRTRSSLPEIRDAFTDPR